MIVSIVPISPVLCPQLSSTLRIIYVVVVLPFVPVIPIVNSFSAGYPNHAADISAYARRVSSVSTTVTFSGIFASEKCCI